MYVYNACIYITYLCTYVRGYIYILDHVRLHNLTFMAYEFSRRILTYFELIIFLLPTSKMYIHRVGFTKKFNATEISSSVTPNL